MNILITSLLRVDSSIVKNILGNKPNLTKAGKSQGYGSLTQTGVSVSAIRHECLASPARKSGGLNRCERDHTGLRAFDRSVSRLKTSGSPEKLVFLCALPASVGLNNVCTVPFQR